MKFYRQAVKADFRKGATLSTYSGDLITLTEKYGDNTWTDGLEVHLEIEARHYAVRVLELENAVILSRLSLGWWNKLPTKEKREVVEKFNSIDHSDEILDPVLRIERLFYFVHNHFTPGNLMEEMKRIFAQFRKRQGKDNYPMFNSFCAQSKLPEALGFRYDESQLTFRKG